MTSSRTETVTVDDGSFAAHVVVPEAGTGPGLLVLQEIFGVNAYIRSVCDRLAEQGYVAMAPDVFWRQEPGFVVEPSEGDAGMGRAFEKMGGYDFAGVDTDLGAALAHLRALPEVDGGDGLIGFCFGGTLSFLGAAALDPTCAVSYYGSGVAGNLHRADDVDCPMLFHFGGDDPYLPIADAEAVVDRFGGVDDVTVMVHGGAGHAFDNDHNPVFSQPEPAASAWAATSTFLARHLPIAGA